MDALTSKAQAGYESGPAPMDVDMEGRTEAPAILVKDLTYCYGGGATVHNRAISEPKLIDVNCMFEKGSRVIVAGANGAGKSTLLSIVGGKKNGSSRPLQSLWKGVLQRHHTQLAENVLW